MQNLQSILLELGTSRRVDAQQVLLRAGEVANKLYLIEQGCARLYTTDAQGRETSIQFFFEGDVVSSLESFLTESPSALSLVTMESCILCVVEGRAIKLRSKTDSSLQASLQKLLQARLVHYVNLYASAIADSPTQRYLALKKTHQQRLERIPLHILSTYLGVSAVHLSRIRRNLKNIQTSLGN
jgi:CRP-like cAMP-binding protein